jgi:TrmH family RNA methyltransferase
MTATLITSTKNQRIVEARKLTQRKHRLRQNRFLVEGLQLLGLALEAAAHRPNKIIPLEVFYSEELFTGETAPKLLTQLSNAGATPLPVAPHILDTLSDRDTAQGLLATFALHPLEHPLSDLPRLLTHQSSIPPSLHPSRLILILDQLQDPGNLGTLIRTADAAGVTAVILREPCVDPFDPKTVRGTMGSIFTMPFLRTGDVPGLFEILSALGYRAVGADGRLGQPPWQSEVLSGPVALVLGNEARGLSQEIQPFLTDYVSLPLRGQAESLNVASAGGVLLYEWLRINEQRNKT